MKHTIHDPKIFALSYPRNLMLAIAKADLIDPETKQRKPPVIKLDHDLEDFITYVPLAHTLNDIEIDILTYHYQYHYPLKKIANDFNCTSENIRIRRNHALNKLLRAYLVLRVYLDDKPDALPTAKIDSSPSPEIISKIKEQFDRSTLAPNEPLNNAESEPHKSYIKPAKNSIKHHDTRKRVKQVIPYKFYIRSDGVLYLEIKDEIAQHYIGEFYSYSNSNFSIEGIVVDISIAGILLTDWEVKRK